MIEEKVVKALRRLPAAQQQEVLNFAEFLAQKGESAVGIERTPGVVGGAPSIARTRIPVWLLVQARQSGASDAEILRSFPALTAEDLANAWAYYQANQEAVEKDIATRP